MMRGLQDQPAGFNHSSKLNVPTGIEIRSFLIIHHLYRT